MPLDDIDVSKPRLFQEDTIGHYFARLRLEDPVHYRKDGLRGLVLVGHQVQGHHGGGHQPRRVLVRVQPRGHHPGRCAAADAPADVHPHGPARHTAQRRTVAPIVAPTNLANMEGIIRRRTQAVLDGLPRNETFDWVDHVSTELTAMMLATLFDFPWADRRKLTHWSDVAIANIEADDAVVKSEAERMAELMQMAEIMGTLWKERAAQPPKFDLISMMAHSEATQNLPLREFIGTFGLLIVGGNDTTRNSMTGGLMAMIEHPAEVAKVRADAGLLSSLVSETIRYQTPVIHMRRTATRDAELGGKRIAKGDKVVMWYVSGNRDETAIEEPERFFVGRARPRHHLAFGAGIHRCVGDRLAEMQLRILWDELLKRDLAIELAGPPVRLYSNFIRGIRALPVRIPG